MIQDVQRFLGDERFVGRTLEELLYPPEVNEQRRKYPDPSTLNIAIEIPTHMEWED